jgi:adenylate cyclase
VTPSARPLLSIVVLPFANLSKDPEHEYFVDGITDDLTTDLSRLSGSFVIARNTAFTYKGKPVDAKQVGHELGVHYILEGSVRRVGDDVRVNVQLIDAGNGAHLWADRFDTDRVSLAAAQDEITGRLALALKVELVADAGRRIDRERSVDPDARDLVMRGRALLLKAGSVAAWQEAVAAFEGALEIDPRSVDARIGLATALGRSVADGWSKAVQQDVARGEQLLLEALADANSASAHAEMGRLRRLQNRLTEAKVELETAIALDRNLVGALRQLGQTMMYLGQPEAGIPYIEKALLLSPRDSDLASVYRALGVCHLLLGHVDQAVELLRRARAENPRFWYIHYWLAAALGLRGELDEARTALAESIRLNPEVSSLSRQRAVQPWGTPEYWALYENTVNVGLRRAGFTDEMTVTRHLAAVLAADVAGYSRLIGADEHGTLQAFRAILAERVDPAIAAYNGRLVKTTGDGFLVEFSSVVDALHCATEVQARMADRNATVPTERRIELRIGINVGDIVVDDSDIFGDGVNIVVRLEGLAEPGGICVSERVQEDAAGKLDLAFEDMGEQQLKNIARPVRVFRVRPGPPADDGRHTPHLSHTLPDKPSVAVLPFINMSGDPEQEFVADGITEDIINALSPYPSLFVIARNSCFTYKGRAVDVKQVGRELGVRYVLEGSLRKSGNRIRVTAQLVEAETGKHVWGEHYDRELADIFALQDEITEAVTIAIAPAIADAEQRRALRRPPGSLDAWAAYQRGLWHVSKRTAEDNELAEKFFHQAVDLDPNFAGGYEGLAIVEDQALEFRPRDLFDTLSSSEALARRAVALSGGDAEARSLLSAALWRRGDYEGALAEAERALATAPNLAAAHHMLAATLIFSGRPKEGIAALERAIRLDPREPRSEYRLNEMALALYFCRDYSAAIDAAKQAIRSYPNFAHPYRWLAAALGQLGRTGEAKEALEKAIVLAPASFDMYVRGRVPWMRVEDYAHMLEGLRKAGWEG